MIHQGDLFDVLPTLDAESVDAGVTDPPYGIGFMGREWDTFRPDVPRKQAHRLVKGDPIVSDNPNINGRRRSPAISESQIFYDRTLRGQREFQRWTERWSVEVLRVLKPGAYLVVCGAPRSHHRMMCGLEDAGFVVRDCFAWLFGSGFPKNYDLGDGKGTALKPAHEPIALAWKPFKGSISACHERCGTAALNIDACRIATAEELQGSTRRSDIRGGNFASGHHSPDPGDLPVYEQSELGRWPANVLLDEDAATMLDEQSGELVSGANPTRRQADKFRGVYNAFAGQVECDAARGLDIGGASRFYYVAKPSREERDLGCHDLEGGNTHPTVKPIALMRWLIRLVTPTDGCVLDPFAGSGTTGIAALLEQRRFIGIEREPQYVAIAKRRIHAAAPLFSEVRP